MVALIAAFLLQETPMSDAEFKKRCEATWNEVRSAFADYRLDDLKKHLDVPPDAPVPNRAQAKAFAEQLPDLSKSRFLKLLREKNRIGYAAQVDVEKPGTAVLVVRFKADGRLVPAPDTMSVYQTDEKQDPQSLLASEPSLRLFPAAGGEPSPALGPSGGAPDARSEAAIRKEVEGVWKRLRDAWAAGTPEKADDVQIWADDRRPSADEAKAAAKDRMPDLGRGRFIKLVWSEKKPQLCGYVAEVNTGNAKKTTLAMIVFARRDGAWTFAHGPAALQVVELPPTAQAKQKQVVESDSRFKLD